MQDVVGSFELALVVLALLADVEAGHRAVVAHDAGPDFAGLALGVGQLHVGGGARAVCSVVVWCMDDLLGVVENAIN